MIIHLVTCEGSDSPIIFTCDCITHHLHITSHIIKNSLFTLSNTLSYPCPTKLEGAYTGFTLSVCPSVHPSVGRGHGFQSMSQVCFGISISNFICMLMVAIGWRSVTSLSKWAPGSHIVFYKMAAWWPYWIFRFLDSVGSMVSGA